MTARPRLSPLVPPAQQILPFPRPEDGEKGSYFDPSPSRRHFAVTPSPKIERDRVGRRTVASYASYQGAQRAAAYLAERGIPAEGLTIVARAAPGPRRPFGAAALAGAVSGALAGGLFGLLLGLLALSEPLEHGVVLTLYGLGFGAVVGALVNVIEQTRELRRAQSATPARGEPYLVLVDAELAENAELLALEYTEDD